MRKKVILSLSHIPRVCKGCGAKITRTKKFKCGPACNEMRYHCSNPKTSTGLSLNILCSANYDVEFPKGLYDLPHVDFRGTFIAPDMLLS